LDLQKNVLSLPGVAGGLSSAAVGAGEHYGRHV